MDFLDAYRERKPEIEKRLLEFRELQKKGDNEIFAELVFCILTPQSRARNCDKAVKMLLENNSINKTQKEIAKRLKGIVRFHKTKARHIIKARDSLLNNGGIKSRLSGNPTEIREWLVNNVYGLGYKEASHFLRNVGLGENLAILDRHILGNLVKHGIIREIPKSLTRKKYMEIEDKFRAFAHGVGIPPAHLDLLLWSQETGEIFK